MTTRGAISNEKCRQTTYEDGISKDESPIEARTETDTLGEQGKDEI